MTTHCCCSVKVRYCESTCIEFKSLSGEINLLLSRLKDD